MIGTVDAEAEALSSTPRLGRFVGGGERRAGGCCGVGGHEEREFLLLMLVRSRWEGVEGCQNVRAREKVECYDIVYIVSECVESKPCESSCVCDISSILVSSFSSYSRLRWRV